LNNNHAYRILLVDDDVLLQNLLVEYLSTHGFLVNTLSNGEDIGQVLNTYPLDLVALDIVMPGKDGLYWLEWLKKHYPHIPVLILSARNSAKDRLRGLELGATDYLIKPFHPKELLIRVKNTLNRYVQMEDQPVKIGEQLFDPTLEILIQDNSLVKLTSLETRLLVLLCQHAGQVLSRDAISYALHGSEHHPMNRSIDMQMNRLRKKLGDTPQSPKHIHTVWRKGYRLVL
jgi:DNA-binding response OmpR family regulator